jgi:hypothetical protein
VSRRTASQAVAAAIGRGAITAARGQFRLAEIADGKATPETVDLLWGPGHPVQASAPDAGPGDDIPEYVALFPATPAEAAARVDAAAAARLAHAEALSDDQLYQTLFPAREP